VALLALSDLWADFFKDRRVVRLLEVRMKHERVRAGLLQGIVQLPSSVGGIDIHENSANRGRGELSQDPLFAVAPQNSHSISIADAQRQQALRCVPDFAVKLCVGQPDTLVTDH
jgi:hypothetical protein